MPLPPPRGRPVRAPLAIQLALLCAAFAVPAPAIAQTLDFDHPAADPNVRDGGDGWEYGEDWEEHRRGGHRDRDEEEEEEKAERPEPQPKPKPKPKRKAAPRKKRKASPRRARDPRVPYGRLIARTARRHRIPVSLFTALVWAESNFNPRARSSVGARGLTQLMPATARSLGVRRIYDPRQNLSGGARYLRAQLTRFRSTKLALAAYNAGPGAVRKYRGVPPYAETRNYVKKIVARAARLRRQGVR